VSPTGNDTNGSAVKLLPHQTALVETVFNPESKRIVLLRGDVGLGKSAALVAVAGRLLQERPTARALFLVPAALRTQFASMLRDASVPSLAVDRYVYREMLDASTASEFWPTGTVAVLSFDFATQPDVQASLELCQWEMVFVDEWHLTRGARAESLHHITASAERVVLASATSPDKELSGFAVGDVTVVEWRRDLVVDSGGKPLPTVPRPVLHEISFRLNPAEIELRATVVDLVKILECDVGAKDWRPVMLFRCLESSPAALERPLQGLMEGATPLDSVDEPLSPLEEPASDDIPNDRSGRSNAEQVAGLAGRALREIEASTTDSKLNALGALLSRINPGESPPRRVLVLTDFVATLFYLAAEIEGYSLACQLLHGSMGTEERVRSLQSFSNNGGILIATRAVIAEGVDLREVTDLVLYDVPRTSAALKQVLGRFDRLGRVSELSVYFFTPSNTSDDCMPDSRGDFAEIFRPNFSEGTRE